MRGMRMRRCFRRRNGNGRSGTATKSGMSVEMSTLMSFGLYREFYLAGPGIYVSQAADELIAETSSDRTIHM
jgi:hypothetical protein